MLYARLCAYINVHIKLYVNSRTLPLKYCDFVFITVKMHNIVISQCKKRNMSKSERFLFMQNIFVLFLVKYDILLNISS